MADLQDAASPGSPDFWRDGRQLAADSSEATLSAWRAAAITASVALALVAAAAAVVWLWHSWRSRSQVEGVPEPSHPAVKPVCDAELGERVPPTGKEASTSKPAPVNLELRDALRELLKEELSRGIQKSSMAERLDKLESREDVELRSEHSSIAERVERLERQLNGNGSGSGDVLRCAAGCDGAEVPLPPGRVPEGKPSLNRAPSRPSFADDFVPPPPPAGAPPPLLGGRKRSKGSSCEKGVGTEPEPLKDYGQKPLRRRMSGCAVGGAFGPTRRQRMANEPPEKAAMHVDEGASLRLSLSTLQKQLQRREAQSKELQRQIQNCQQALWQQTLNSKTVRRRLKELSGDPAAVPRLQAEQVQELRREKESMSSRLSETRNAELHWATMARRHRAFFLQSERLVSEGVETSRGVIMRTHPAGEIFLAPSPVTADGDEEDWKRTPWDVGTSIINPYATDSWPFEPNVLAQRMSMEPTLNPWDEEDAEAIAAELLAEEEEEEENSDASSSQAQLDALLQGHEDAAFSGHDGEGDEEGDELGEDIIEAHLASVGASVGASAGTSRLMRLPQPPAEVAGCGA